MRDLCYFAGRSHVLEAFERPLSVALALLQICKSHVDRAFDVCADTCPKIGYYRLVLFSYSYSYLHSYSCLGQIVN